MFSIVILTYNEECNLRDCLKSIDWCDDIWVVDSGSSDKTLEIAKSFGCHILTRKFDDFGSQRNYAIDNANFKYEWVFDLDADERFTKKLKSECEEVIIKNEKSAYYCSYKNIMWGKWLKHSTGFPVYQMRLHKLGEIRFVSHGHGQKEGDALRGIGYLKEPYIHYDFSKGLASWFAKHVGYAKREAELRLEEEKKQEKAGCNDIVKYDIVSKRRKLKKIAYRMPFQPVLRFIYVYFINKGFLDGLAGLHFATMQMCFQFMICTIYKDLKQNEKHKNVMFYDRLTLSFWKRKESNGNQRQKKV